MKTRQPNIKYVEWKSAEELHEMALDWISELKFVKDEQHFLDELLEEHTFQILSGKTFEESSEIIRKISKRREELEPLLKKIIQHHNELTILMDGIDQPKEEQEYKEHHRELVIEVNTYFNSYKKTKLEIFDLIKSIMKMSKQKRLLN